MFSVSGHDFKETVPVYRYNEDGTVSNVRPSIFHRQAQQDVAKHGSRNRVGYLVKNQYGDIKPMEFKKARRMVDLFERKFLEIVDYWTVPYVPAEYGLTGCDTECEGSGIYDRF